MRGSLRRWAPVIQSVAGIVVAGVAASEMVGKPARPVGLLAVCAGMFAAGLGLGALLGARRGRDRTGS